MATNFNFRSSAIESTTLSRLLAGKEKISTEEVIAKYPNGITITEFDIIAMPSKKDPNVMDTFPVVGFAESDKEVFFGGTVLMKIFNAWITNFDSIEDCSDALRESGGVKVKMQYAKTRNNNNVVTVRVL